VIELHGNLLRLKSFVDEEAAFAAEVPPVICPVCDGYAAWAAVEACDLLIAVGASLEVEPAASLPWRALQKGAQVIEVNPAPTALAEHCHASFAGSAAEVLPTLFASINQSIEERITNSPVCD